MGGNGLLPTNSHGVGLEVGSSSAADLRKTPNSVSGVGVAVYDDPHWARGTLMQSDSC